MFLMAASENTTAAAFTLATGTIATTTTTRIIIISISSPVVTLASTSIVPAALPLSSTSSLARRSRHQSQFRTRSKFEARLHLRCSTSARGFLSPWRTESMEGRCDSVAPCLAGPRQGCTSESWWSVRRKEIKHGRLLYISSKFSQLNNETFLLC